jgi:hypothetical protein
MFSPGEPQVTKKAKRSPQPAKAATKHKKRVHDSDEEEEAEFDDEPVVRTSKPSRARKTAKNAYHFVGSDDNEDEEGEEFSD